MTRRSFDLSLYLVTDEPLAGKRPLGQVVRAAIEGGVTAVQIREKSSSTRGFVEQAEALREIAARAGVALIVNDRIDVALAVDADGVHVGRHDMPVRVARSLLGPQRILGVTASDAAEAQLAERDGADYIGCSAVFPTPTKQDTGTPLGLDGLSKLVQGTNLPVVAIGGIKPENAERVMETGVAGVAVVSAIVAAEDPRAAAAELASIVWRAKARSRG